MQLQSVSYDVQIFADGRWRSVKMVRNRDVALKAARGIELGSARQAVRVLREAYDPQSGRFSQDTIFRQSALNRGRIEAARADLAVARLLRNRRSAPTPRGAGSSEWALFSALGVRLFALMTGSAGAMLVLDRIVSS